MNEFIGLTNMNQIWMREHNRVTDFFIKINGHWSDERLYQESRRVVIAEMQHVVYNEFVPLLLGTFKEHWSPTNELIPLLQQKQQRNHDAFVLLHSGEKLTKSLGLNPLKEGYFHGYDDNLDAGVANSFASAAFRFYHSMIKVYVPNAYKWIFRRWFNAVSVQDLVAFEQAGSGVTEFAQLHTMLYNPFPMWQFGKVDELIRGSAAQNPRPIHTSFAAEVLRQTSINEMKCWRELNTTVSYLVCRWPIICSSKKTLHSDSTCSPSTSSADVTTAFRRTTNGARYATCHLPPISRRWKSFSVLTRWNSSSAFTCKKLVSLSASEGLCSFQNREM